MTNDNDVVIKAWNTALFDKFRRFKHLLIDRLGRRRSGSCARGRIRSATFGLPSFSRARHRTNA